MSNEFLEKFGKKKVTREQMRKWCQRPGKADKDGNPIYTTEQHHKKECDVNEIIKKYDRQGIITHISRFEARFGDMTGNDFTSMQQQLANAMNQFESLPSEIRNKFDNSPADLLRFMENPANRDEAIKLGMIREDWPEAQDGIGEHVVRDDKGEVVPEEPPA